MEIHSSEETLTVRLLSPDGRKFGVGCRWMEDARNDHSAERIRLACLRSIRACIQSNGHNFGWATTP